MLELILSLCYPLFLVIAFVLTSLKGTAPTSLRGIARWLLAIALAYAATFGLAFVAWSFATDSFELRFRGLGYTDSFYWSEFWRDTFESAMAMLIVTLVLFALDWLRRRSSNEVSSEASDVFASGTTWVFPLAFLITILLAVFLLIEPFFDYVTHHQQVYAATHNRGLDPRDWFPFSWEWPGIFFYETAFLVWFFVAFFLPPLVVADLFTVKNAWRKLHLSQRILQAGTIASTAVLSVFTLTFGRAILYWLLD